MIRGTYFAVTIVLLVAYGIWLVRWLGRTPSAPVAINVAINSLWSVASCLYIESGIYVIEQDRYSGLNGSAAVLLLVCALFFAAVQGTLARLPRISVREQIVDDWQYRAMLFAAFGALALLYFNLALSPVPLFNSAVDRYDYWKNARFPFLHSLLGNTTSIIAFILGLAYARCRARGQVTGRLYIAGFAAYVIYLVLLGHKFGALLTAIWLWVIPILAVRQARIQLRARIVVSTLLIVLALGGLAVYQYSKAFNPYGAINTFDAVLYRAMGLQGHLWWGIWQERIVEGVSPTLALGQFGTGMETLMLGYGGPGNELDPERGVSFTSGYPGIALHVLPFAAVPLVQLIVGAGLAVISWYLYRLIRTDRALEACVLMQFALRFDYTVTMGTFSKIISLPALALIIFYVIRECQLASSSSAHASRLQAST